MSIRIDYLSNGKKALYCVRNAGVTPSTYMQWMQVQAFTGVTWRLSERTLWRFA